MNIRSQASDVLLRVLFRRHTCLILCIRSRAVRGQVIAGFSVDFYCHKAALVLEVDGDIHDLQHDEDARREKVLREMGLRVAVSGISE